MSLKHWEDNAQVFKAVNSTNRLKTFYWLYQDQNIQDITDELGLTRSAVQYYIDDFKDTDLIRSEGKQYIITEKGQYFAQLAASLDTYHKMNKLEELESALEETDVDPETVPQLKDQLNVDRAAFEKTKNSLLEIGEMVDDSNARGDE